MLVTFVVEIFPQVVVVFIIVVPIIVPYFMSLLQPVLLLLGHTSRLLLSSFNSLLLAMGLQLSFFVQVLSGASKLHELVIEVSRNRHIVVIFDSLLLNSCLLLRCLAEMLTMIVMAAAAGSN